jgi:predicted flap endonuclease-1-like 5' DNA nuclease
MWDQTFKRWIDLVFWWLPKQEAAKPPAPKPAAPAKAAPRQVAAQHAAPKQTAEAMEKRSQEGAPKQAAPQHAATTAAAPDDLTVIKGIGPVVQQKLHALGIKTFGDLAAADPARLTEQLKGRQPISQALVRGWTKAADQRITTRH